MKAALPLLLALAADAWLGDPPVWPHFVRWVGKAIAWLETRLRALCGTAQGLRLAGVALALLVVGGSALAAWLALKLAYALLPILGLALAALLAFQCLAAGQLWREAKAVLAPLEAGDLVEARRSLAMIVGRDTGQLSEMAVRRAVIETLAENLNDGVIAPLFYLALGGPVLGVAYKAVNTLDSMVGYKDERYADLGWASARLDDLAGWLPARLTAALIIAAAPLLGLNPGQALQATLLFHDAHKSPNSAWSEAAMAGALDLRLGGPNFYHGQLVDKPWINPSGRDPLPPDALAALRVLVMATSLAGSLVLLNVWLARGWV